MSPLEPSPNNDIIALHGEALLQQINDVSNKLSRRTLLTMALGGLRARLMRSTVTLLSIVLAIAFLCYTGLANKLVFLLASATQQIGNPDMAQIERLLRSNGVNARLIVSEGNPMDNWLIIMALLTCAVGIANAMLMSVTERIREIGTMKCLGAVDAMVVKLFLIESGLLGVIGSLGGIVLGLLVAMLAAGLGYGRLGMVYFPWLTGISVAAWSLCAGLVLAVGGAVYPAFVAARMKPVDALRVDE